MDGGGIDQEVEASYDRRFFHFDLFRLGDAVLDSCRRFDSILLILSRRNGGGDRRVPPRPMPQAAPAEAPQAPPTDQQQPSTSDATGSQTDSASHAPTSDSQAPLHVDGHAQVRHVPLLILNAQHIAFVGANALTPATCFYFDGILARGSFLWSILQMSLKLPLNSPFAALDCLAIVSPSFLLQHRSVFSGNALLSKLHVRMDANNSNTKKFEGSID